MDFENYQYVFIKKSAFPRPRPYGREKSKYHGAPYIVSQLPSIEIANLEVIVVLLVLRDLENSQRKIFFSVLLYLSNS